MAKFYLIIRGYLTVFFLIGSIGVWAQSRTITGSVTDSDDGSGLPGVNVLEKGTTNGAVTNADGTFTIQVSGSNSVLVFSFVGYATSEVSVGAQTTINMVLQSDVTALQEIVVTGYGSVQKKDATGAVINMSNKDFNKGVMSSPQDLIVGKFAGVSVINGSGAPGSGAQIRIRGGASLTASNDPLIVIDGFPIDNASVPGIANGLSSLNPNDIATFTVLKDASATAIYGSRASNGVIIITTKKGAKGDLKLSYDANMGISKPVDYIDVMNGDEYRDLIDDLQAAGTFGITAADKAKLGTANTDWQKEIFRTSVSQDHNLSASGAIKNMPFRVSYGYTNQQGILKTTSFIRNSLNINVNPTLLNGDLKMNLSLKGSINESNFGDAGAVGNAVAFDPTQPVRDGNEKYGGYFSWLSKGVVQGNSNPVAMLEQTDNQGSSNRIIANAELEYHLPFFRDIKATLNMGVDRSSSDGYNRAPIESGFIHSTGTLIGRNNTYSGKNESELLDFYLTYSKQINEHKIDATAGYGWQHFYRESDSKNVSTIQITDPPPSLSENFLVSFFGRVNYAYKGKYLVTATLRNDGSSRFAKENRWGLFPSLALAWRVIDEGFMGSGNFFSDLKLRAGYGVTGQQDIFGDYPYLAVYRESNELAQYQLGNAFYYTQRPEPYDAQIKWEETETINLGIDFGFLNDKITGSIEVFEKNTSDLLNNIAIPNGVNFSNFLTTNVGSMKNQGIEVTLSYTPVTRPDFFWNIGMNFTSINSEITKLNLTNDPTYLGVFVGGIGVDAFIQNHQVGFPAFSYFPYQQVYNEAGRPIEGLYADLSGQGGTVVGNSLNRYRYKTPVAPYLIGFNTRLTYKKWDFSFSSRLSLGNYVYNNVESGRAFYNGAFTLQHFRNIPKYITDTEFVSQQQISDYYVQDASFFKMDNISTGYSFDNLFNGKTKARLSVTVQNAFVITDYKGLDPEIIGGIDNNIYPRPRTVLMGVSVTF